MSRRQLQLLVDKLEDIGVTLQLKKIAGDHRLIIYTEFTETLVPLEGEVEQVFGGGVREYKDRCDVYIFQDKYCLETRIKTGDERWTEFYGRQLNSAESIVKLIGNIFKKGAITISGWSIPTNYHPDWNIEILKRLIRGAARKTWIRQRELEDKLTNEIDLKNIEDSRLFHDARYILQSFPHLKYWHVVNQTTKDILCIRSDLGEAFIAYELPDTKD